MAAQKKTLTKKEQKTLNHQINRLQRPKDAAASINGGTLVTKRQAKRRNVKFSDATKDIQATIIAENAIKSGRYLTKREAKRVPQKNRAELHATAVKATQEGKFKLKVGNLTPKQVAMLEFK